MKVVIQGGPTQVKVGTPGIQGKPGVEGEAGAGGDLSFTHPQSVASQSWSIEHNLGKHPSVTVVDSAGRVGYGTVQHIDANHLVVSFSAPFAGTAYLN